MNEIAQVFLAFFSEHSFLSYFLVALVLFVAVMGFSAVSRMMGLKLKAWWGILLFYILLLPIWFCIGLIGLLLMTFSKRLRVYFRF